MKFSLLLSFLMLTVGCSALPLVVNHPDKFAGQGDNKIYIVSHGWHTGFVVPAKPAQERIPQLEHRFGAVRYIEFGWGDKGFYQTSEITSGLTLQAIFWPTESVIHSVAVPQDPEIYFQNSKIASLCLSDEEFSSLLTFINNSFYRNSNGEIQILQKGIYGNSQFYKGVGDFYLMNTCNKWTAKGLKSAGMDISTTFKLTASSVMDYLRKQSYELTHVLNKNGKFPVSLSGSCQ